jgi:hypothetical protein
VVALPWLHPDRRSFDLLRMIPEPGLAFVTADDPRPGPHLARTNVTQAL